LQYTIEEINPITLRLVSNRGFEIFVAKLDRVGSVEVDVTVGELKGNEEFIERAFTQVTELAGRLGLDAPELQIARRHLSLNWSIGKFDTRELILELAKLLDSPEFAQAVSDC
jgi:hypothetical protein